MCIMAGTLCILTDMISVPMVAMCLPTSTSCTLTDTISIPSVQCVHWNASINTCWITTSSITRVKLFVAIFQLAQCKDSITVVTGRSHDACYRTTICTSAISIFLLNHYWFEFYFVFNSLCNNIVFQSLQLTKNSNENNNSFQLIKLLNSKGLIGKCNVYMCIYVVWVCNVYMYIFIRKWVAAGKCEAAGIKNLPAAWRHKHHTHGYKNHICDCIECTCR